MRRRPKRFSKNRLRKNSFVVELLRKQDGYLPQGR